LFVAMKAGKNQGHQTHNDLDAGDFVLDALGTRWAGELGSGDYRSEGYFSSDAQESERWLYYRKRTEGQNTIVVGQGNQNVLAAPTVKHDSSNTAQGSSTVADIPKDSTAFWTADLTSAYFNVYVHMQFHPSPYSPFTSQDLLQTGCSFDQWQKAGADSGRYNCPSSHRMAHAYQRNRHSKRHLRDP
jgi:hypothetical protein